LHETRFAETKGTGIRVMRETMLKAGLSPPAFDSDRARDEFSAVFLFHHFLSEEDVRWLARFREFGLSDEDAKALVYVREVGAIDNAVYRDLNRVDPLTASQRLRQLRERGLLEVKGRTSGTRYVPGPAMRAARDQVQQGAVASIPDKGPSIPDKGPGAEVSAGEEPPPELVALIARLRRRAHPDDLRAAVLELCRWRPHTLDELAARLGRRPEYLSDRVVRPLLVEGAIRFHYPASPRHPEQGYVARDADDRA
jgi:ATP-dependent DNA helicase RecG